MINLKSLFVLNFVLIGVFLFITNVFADSSDRTIIDEVDVSAVVLTGDALPPVIRNVSPSSDPIFLREDTLQSFSVDIEFVDDDFDDEVTYTIASDEGSNNNRTGTISSDGTINFYYRAPMVEDVDQSLLDEEITITLSNSQDYTKRTIGVYVY
ncbi:hypothetical protein [Candidatus Absconditicoccus praedator]|uniref:hypothetical protein n=1 Tax=Candidatus Absconditicoccus praedator TaxID=2735562 RepID=UPI001E433B81|nr:hypothetical protein [Candidatus Absconditicoccus praedator]UFX83499.1 hypothetical protein HLG78_05210 [Candidatus Absconditicoccus praedator]